MRNQRECPKITRWFYLCWLLFWLTACQGEGVVLLPTVTATAVPTATPLPPTPTVDPANLPIYTYRVLNTYPHDANAFTQGLDFAEDGVLYEGTGLYGRSSLRRVNLETGEVAQQIDLAADLFGEGITVWEDKIIQLTWQNQTGFVYDRETLAQLQQFTYPTEGWGITHDGEKLIVSDGTATLYFWQPETLQEIGRVMVHDIQGPVVRLNELEYVEGEVFANIWQTDRIARINPTTGQVIGWIDLTGLLNQTTLTQPVDVLNGIVYDDKNGRLFVTGKLWPVLFEIELIPAP